MDRMLEFIARRLLAIIPVLAVVAVAVFLLLRLTPGDPAAVIAGDSATTEQIEEIRADLGLDKPISDSVRHLVRRVLRGDLGDLFLQEDGGRADRTAARTDACARHVCTMVLAVAIAVPLGVLAAWRHGGWLDRA